MRKISIVTALAFVYCGAALAGGPMDMKGKMKPGLYEYKTDMEISGMPAGMGKQSTTNQSCVTAKDIEGGDLAKPDKDSKCELKDVKSSGDVTTYKMVCTGEGAMTADAKMVFRDGGYTTDLTMSMKQGGQTTNMKQHIDAKYMGACPK